MNLKAFVFTRSIPQLLGLDQRPPIVPVQSSLQQFIGLDPRKPIVPVQSIQQFTGFATAAISAGQSLELLADKLATR